LIKLCGTAPAESDIGFWPIIYVNLCCCILLVSEGGTIRQFSATLKFFTRGRITLCDNTSFNVSRGWFAEILGKR
jgi:hypothetical protein